MTTESIQKEAVTKTSNEVNSDLSQNADHTDIPLDSLLTRKQVSDILKVDIHTLSTRRNDWADVLPMICFKGSNIIRYRKKDVMRLIKEGYRPLSVKDSEEDNNGHR